jgi:branched-chain amino acid aminotransferase
MKIYIDGGYFEKENARISVYDHGLLYGDGVFEGIRVYGGRVFRLREHIDRIFKSARAILIEPTLSPAEMTKAVEETVALNGTIDGYIRLLVTRGVGNLGVDPTQCPKPSVIIIVDSIELYPKEFYEQGIAIVTAATRRTSADCLDPRIKSLNYLNNVLAKLEARRAGCLEAVLLNGEGQVTECTGDNIFIVSGGILATPPSVCGALDGITRACVLELAENADVKAEERVLTRYDLHTADECFLTGTGAEIMPVTSVDGRRIGDGKPGAITKKLIAGFRSLVAV